MRTTTQFCEKCKKALLKIRAQTGKGDINLGTYCPHCRTYRTEQGNELVPKIPTREEVKAALGGIEPSVLPGCSIRSKARIIPHPRTAEDLYEESKKNQNDPDRKCD